MWNNVLEEQYKGMNSDLTNYLIKAFTVNCRSKRNARPLLYNPSPSVWPLSLF